MTTPFADLANRSDLAGSEQIAVQPDGNVAPERAALSLVRQWIRDGLLTADSISAFLTRTEIEALGYQTADDLANAIARIPAATEDRQGLIKVSDDGEADTGSSDTSALSPAKARRLLETFRYLRNRGGYDPGEAYAPGDLAGGRGGHANTNYVCIQAVAANTAALTEPGAGSDWERYWIVLGHRVNNPDAFTGVTEDDDAGTITLNRAGGGSAAVNVRDLADPPSGSAGAVIFRELWRATIASIPTGVDDENEPMSVRVGSTDDHIIEDSVNTTYLIEAIDDNNNAHSEVITGATLRGLTTKERSLSEVDEGLLGVFYWTNAAGHLIVSGGFAALDNVTIIVRKLEGGDNSVDSGLSYFALYNALTNPALTLTTISTNRQIPGSAANGYEQTLLDTSIPAGIKLGAPLFSSFNGTLLARFGNNRLILAEFIFTLFAGTTKAVTFIRRVWQEVLSDVEITLPMQVFSNDAIFAPGQYPGDSGSLVTLAQSDFDRPVPVIVKIRIRGYDKGSFTNRNTVRLEHLEAFDIGAAIYQIGPLPGVQPSSPLPSITRFDVTGTQHVAPGTDISGYRYEFDAQVAHAAQAGTVRIVGYAGALDSNPSVVDVLDTFDAADFVHKTGSVQIPANTAALANADDAYNIALQVYAAGLTPGTDAPTAHQDYRITAIAPAAQVHFGYLLSTEDADDIDFDDDISTSGQAAGTYPVSGVPDDGNNYGLYLAVPASLTQPTSATSLGLPASASWGNFAATDRTIDGVAYKLYFTLDSLDSAGSDWNGVPWVFA